MQLCFPKFSFKHTPSMIVKRDMIYSKVFKMDDFLQFSFFANSLLRGLFIDSLSLTINKVYAQS